MSANEDDCWKDVVQQIIKTPDSDKEAAIKNLPDSLMNNESFISTLLSKNQNLVRWMASEFKDNEKIIKIAISYDGYLLEQASKRLQHSKTFVKMAVEKSPDFFVRIPDEFKDDEEIFSIALSHHYIESIFPAASEQLRGIKEFVLTAVKKDGFMFNFVSKELQNDKEVVLLALQSCPDVFEIISKELQDDDEVVELALSKKVSNFKFVSPRFKNDKKLSLRVVQLNGVLLEYSSEELQNDNDVAKTAVDQNFLSLAFVGSKLKKDYTSKYEHENIYVFDQNGNKEINEFQLGNYKKGLKGFSKFPPFEMDSLNSKHNVERSFYGMS